jgi:arylsulfatase A-like enzyme
MSGHAWGASRLSREARPNILYIMSDDHATTAIGAYGGRLAVLNPTPRLDALAASGTLFENALVTNAICTPSRATILTGQYSPDALHVTLDKLAWLKRETITAHAASVDRC